MFDQFLIRKDSLENVTENGRVTGFRFAVRIADYRGCFLSLHNGYYLTVDGVEYPNDLQKFQINGKDEGFVYVKKDGGLSAGMHHVGIQQSILAQYGYMPWDEEWVLHPPVPGSGQGAGKTETVSYYDLVLSQGGDE